MKITEEQKKQRQEDSKKKREALKSLSKKIRDAFPAFTDEELKLLFPEIFP